MEQIEEMELTNTQKVFLNRVKAEMEASEKERQETIEREKNAEVFSANKKPIIANIIIYTILALSLGILAYSMSVCIQACLSADHDPLISNMYLVEAIMILDIATLLISSAWPYWNYHHRKRFFIIVVISSTAIVMFEILFCLISAIIVPLLLLPEPNQWVTKSKWMFLIRSVVTFPPMIITVFFVQFECEVAFSEFALNMIYRYRILDHIDIRKNKKYLYDVKVVRNIENYAHFNLREGDRYRHVLINGQSGTAKSSSVIIPMIEGDLRTRCRNEDMIKKILYKGLKHGDYRLNSFVKDRSFSPDAFTPTNPGAEKQLKILKKMYRIAGMTIICPDSSLSDAVYKLCEAKNIPCNRVDPIPDKDTDAPKTGFKGFNPLYISPLLSESRRLYETVKRASLMADVMQSVYEMRGKGDPYFTSINRMMTVSFAICLIVTMPVLDGRQPTPMDVRNMVNDFDRIRDYYKELRIINAGLTGEYENYYGFVIDYIGKDVLISDNDKLKRESNGLRTLMNEFLANPYVRRIFCAEGKDTIDMDEILEKGQITVVNYALELGKQDSLVLGQFFLLSFINAVWRRDGSEGSTVSPHMLVIDELPVIIHPAFEQAVSIFRKYKVSIVAALQTLDQMEKNPETKYLSNVLQGIATHILFGSCSREDQKRYSDKCGKEWIVVEESSQTETSITSDNPALTYTTRESLRQQNIIEPTDLYNKGFQLVTLFSIVNNNVIPPINGKVSFIKEKSKNWLKRPLYHWEKFYNGILISDIEPEKPVSAPSKNDYLYGAVVYDDHEGDEENEEDDEDDICLTSGVPHNNFYTENDSIMVPDTDVDGTGEAQSEGLKKYTANENCSITI